MLSRIERALTDDVLTGLVTELRAEGHSIAAVYRLLYGGFQDSLRAARRMDDVAKLLAACEAVQHALGTTFEPELFATIDRHLQAGTLRALVVDLHDREAWTKRRLYDTFFAFSFALDAAGREAETDIIDDELDVLSGWCAAAARLWPDEPLD